MAEIAMKRDKNMVNLAQSNSDIDACFDVMSQLRPHIIKEAFAPLVHEMMSEGYQLAYIEKDGKVCAVAGYKIATNLFLGKNLYIEDLVTDEDMRSEGIGALLLDELIEAAKKAGCVAIHLDSGVQRHGAHKFYLKNDFNIVCYHFLKHVE